MRAPNSRLRCDCWHGEAWSAGTTHQPCGSPSSEQQLHDADGLRTGIWYCDTELAKAGGAQLAEPFWTSPNLEGVTNKSPRDVISVPAVRFRQQSFRRKAEITQPASAGAARAEAVWSPSLLTAKWTGWLNSSLEWRNRKPTSIPGSLGSKTPDTETEEEEMIQIGKISTTFRHQSFRICGLLTRHKELITKPSSWSFPVKIDDSGQQPCCVKSHLSKAETSSWSFTVTHSSTETELNYSFKGDKLTPLNTGFLRRTPGHKWM